LKLNPSSFHAPANGKPSEGSNSDKMIENLNQSNQQLLQTIEELKAENVKLRLFINIAAHELRTPIMPIVGYSEMLQEDIGERMEIKGIIYNAKRLEQLAGNILEGAKIENHTLQLHNEHFNLKDLIFDIIRDYEDQLIMKGKNGVRLQYEPKDIFLVADKIRLGRVISNLLNNAIKFTANGEITIDTEGIKQKEMSTMETKLGQKNEQHRGEVYISIKDTGPGLSPVTIPKLFSKFVSTDYGGTGLGLFISKNIIESHGGRIWAENNIDGKGAQVSFTLPVKIKS
jgi:signal transduction histidine kinase